MKHIVFGQMLYTIILQVSSTEIFSQYEKKNIEFLEEILIGYKNIKSMFGSRSGA